MATSNNSFSEPDADLPRNRAVPGYLAGPGPGVPVERLLEQAGWVTHWSPDGYRCMSRPDLGATLALLAPEKNNHLPSPHWQVTVRPTPDAESAWVATFSADVPGEFLAAVADPHGLPREPQHIPFTSRSHVCLVSESAADTLADTFPTTRGDEHATLPQLRAGLRETVTARFDEAAWLVLDARWWGEGPDGYVIELHAVLARDNTVLYQRDTGSVLPHREAWASTVERLATRIADREQDNTPDDDAPGILDHRNRQWHLLPVTPWAQQHIERAAYQPPPPPATDTSAATLEEVRATVLARHPQAAWLLIEDSYWAEQPDHDNLDIIAVLDQDATALYEYDTALPGPYDAPWAKKTVRLLTRIARDTRGEHDAVLRTQLTPNGYDAVPLTPWAEEHTDHATYEMP